MSPPVLEVLQLGGGDRGLVWLARALTPWWEVRSARNVRQRPAARFAVVGPRRQQHVDLSTEGIPYVVAARASDLPEVDADLVASAAAIVTDGPPATPVAPPVYVAPPLRFEPRRWRPAAPFVRVRRLQRLGLHPGVLECRRPAALDAGQLGMTAVAIVDLDWALPALALATPCVTDPATATTLGIVDGEHAVVVEPAEAADAAADLLDDVDRSAALSRRGRQFVEDRHDDQRMAICVSRHLGVDPWSSHRPDLGLLGHRVFELGAPYSPTVLGGRP